MLELGQNSAETTGPKARLGCSLTSPVMASCTINGKPADALTSAIAWAWRRRSGGGSCRSVRFEKMELKKNIILIVHELGFSAWIFMGSAPGSPFRFLGSLF